MKQLFYNTYSSPFDEFTIVWREYETRVLIQRIFLSGQKIKSETRMKEFYPTVEIGDSKVISIIGEKIQQFLQGKKIQFELDVLDFSMCYKIQKKVILAEYEIPRGWVSTYARIAKHVGIKNGARVIGNALAKNPFPIIIPCHRAIKSDRTLGGYQGGISMKRKLLEMEGVTLSEKGKVITENIFY